MNPQPRTAQKHIPGKKQKLKTKMKSIVCSHCSCPNPCHQCLSFHFSCLGTAAIPSSGRCSLYAPDTPVTYNLSFPLKHSQSLTLLHPFFPLFPLE